MATIEKRGGRYRVRWYDPDGKPRTRACPDVSTAKKIKLDVEGAVSQGVRWQPRDTRPEPDLIEILDAYSRRCARALAPGTAIRYAQTLDVFIRWLRAQHGARGRLPASLLSSKLLSDFYAFLGTTGLHERPRGVDTRRKNVEVIQLAWEFAANDDAFADLVPRPRTIEMPRSPSQSPIAPRWANVDALAWALDGWMQQIAILMRFTGLRISQTTRLLWSDVNLDEATLIIRGALGKTRQEKRGRVVPIAAPLVHILRARGPKEGAFIVESDRARGGDRDRMPRQEAFRRAWAEIGMRPDVWKSRSSHAIRKGFISELKRSGADDEAVEYLVGHSLRLRGVYGDPDALPLRDAVARIPPLSPPPPTSSPSTLAWWQKVVEANAAAEVAKVPDEEAPNATVVRMADVVRSLRSNEKK